MTLKEIFKSIERKEWLYIALTSISLIVLTSIPYFLGYFTRPVNFYYLALPSLNRGDFLNYLSFIEQAKSGQFLFEGLYSSEPQPRVIFHLFFLFLGLVAKIFNLSSIFVFQLSRVTLIIIFLLVTYFFLGFIFPEKQKRKVCFLFICFSSGIGFWLLGFLTTFGVSTILWDLWIVESVTFLTLFNHPLFILSLTMIIAIFFLILLALKNGNWKYSLAAGLIGLLLFQVHPYHFLTIFWVFGCFWLFLFLKEGKINQFLLTNYLIFTLIALPSLIYYWWLTKVHWINTQRVIHGMSTIPEPNILNLVLGYGFLWPLVLIGLWYLVKKQLNQVGLFLTTWLLAQAIILFSPIPLRIKLLEGFHFIICIFATLGLFHLYQTLKTSRSKILPRVIKFLTEPESRVLLLIIFILFFTFSNLYSLIYEAFYTSPVYISQAKIEAITWLKKNTPSESIIFSHYSEKSGGLIPVFSIRKVYAGHWAETVAFRKKIMEIRWFFEKNNYDLAKKEFLKENKINYLFYSNEEKELGNFQPDEKFYLKKLFENSEAKIYQVINL